MALWIRCLDLGLSHAIKMHQVRRDAHQTAIRTLEAQRETRGEGSLIPSSTLDLATSIEVYRQIHADQTDCCLQTEDRKKFDDASQWVMEHLRQASPSGPASEAPDRLDTDLRETVHFVIDHIVGPSQRFGRSLADFRRRLMRGDRSAPSAAAQWLKTRSTLLDSWELHLEDAAYEEFFRSEKSALSDALSLMHWVAGRCPHLQALSRRLGPAEGDGRSKVAGPLSDFAKHCTSMARLAQAQLMPEPPDGLESHGMAEGSDPATGGQPEN